LAITGVKIQKLLLNTDFRLYNTSTKNTELICHFDKLCYNRHHLYQGEIVKFEKWSLGDVS